MERITDWEIDCLTWRGEVLTGEFSHWCYDWDGLPIDETCGEWPCACYCREHKKMDCECREEQ